MLMNMQMHPGAQKKMQKCDALSNFQEIPAVY
jgi:hypothetical protein